jgi:hypothetical protein
LGSAAARASASATCHASFEPRVRPFSADPSLDIEDEDDCEGDATTRVETAVGSAAALHAACSRDPSGLTLSYHWQIVDQPNGSAIELPNDAVISPTVIPDLPGRYALSLIVSNGTLTSAATTVAIDAE